MRSRRRLCVGLATALCLAALPLLVTSAPAGAAPGPGYWMVDAAGHVSNFGAAADLGQPRANFGVVDIESRVDGTGYWVVDRLGEVLAFGAAHNLGDRPALSSGERIVSIARSTTGDGYWLMSSRGRTFNYGDAPDVGDVTDFTPNHVALNQPIIDAAKTVNGTGVYMVAEDGGVFAMGDAPFLGSMGGTALNSPVRSLVPDPDGRGYWLIAGDGGVFSFEAPFKGSMGSAKLNGPVVGMVAFGEGYLQVGSDGGVFNFSNLPFLGSLGGASPSPVVGIAAFASGGSPSPTTTLPGGSTTTTLPGGSTTTTLPSTTTTTPLPSSCVTPQLFSGGVAGLTRSSASADGSKIAFESDADLAGIDALLTKPAGSVVRDPNNYDINNANPNLNDTDNQRDIFLWDCNGGGVGVPTLKRITNGIWYFDQAGTGSQYGSTDHQTANGSSVSPSLSADGRYLAFSSRADNPGIDGHTVVTGVNQHHAYGIFVLDTQSGSVERVDMIRSGEHWTAWDHGSRETPVQISADGRFVTYQQASRVNDAAANYSNQIYLYDRQLHRTTLVSAVPAVSPPGGGTANEMPGEAMSPSISSDGRTIAFSYQPNPALPAGVNTSDVYVWTANSDLLTNAAYWIDITVDPLRGTLPTAPTGSITRLTTGLAASMWPRISSDGTRVAFTSYANLDGASDPNARTDNYMPLYFDSFPSSADLFVCTRGGGGWTNNCSGGTFSRVTNSASGAFMPWLSGNGQYLAFQSDDSTPLDATGVSTGTGVFVYDLSAHFMVFNQHAVAPGNQGPFLSSASHYVVYTDRLGNLYRQTFT